MLDEIFELSLKIKAKKILKNEMGINNPIKEDLYWAVAGEGNRTNNGYDIVCHYLRISWRNKLDEYLNKNNNFTKKEKKDLYKKINMEKERFKFIEKKISSHLEYKSRLSAQIRRSKKLIK